PSSCAELFVLPVTVIAAMVAAAIAVTIAITASVPATTPAVTNKAYLVSLNTAHIDGADVANRQSGSRGRESNREGGRGKRQFDDVHEILPIKGKRWPRIMFQE